MSWGTSIPFLNRYNHLPSLHSFTCFISCMVTSIHRSLTLKFDSQPVFSVFHRSLLHRPSQLCFPPRPCSPRATILTLHPNCDTLLPHIRHSFPCRSRNLELSIRTVIPCKPPSYSPFFIPSSVAPSFDRFRFVLAR